MTCQCSLGRETCNCGLCEPIKTDFGDIEDERSRMGGLVAMFGWAVCVVCMAAAFVMAFGPGE